MAAQIIDGKAVAQRLRGEIKTKVADLVAHIGVAPHLVVVLASDDPASAVYVRNKGKAAEEVGIRSTQHTLPANTEKAALLELIRSSTPIRTWTGSWSSSRCPNNTTPKP
jgi:methylenetetrahydrofolate dehydrogenase (NADP+)/methenyltetrahydrofolate cyclohydrolase